VLLVHTPVMYAGGGFPWGLLIIGGLLYLLWQKGAFGGPGNRGFGRSQMPGGPRDLFEQWHREAHQAGTAQAAPPQAAQPQAPVAPAADAPTTPTATAASSGADTPPASQPPQAPTAGPSGPMLERW
jgi:hypothetical protein